MDKLWITVTHARLRARQGDLAGAQRVLDQVLARNPGDPAALRFREELQRGLDTEPAQPQLPAPGEDPARAALAAELAARVRQEFRKDPDPRIARLNRWLDAIEQGSRPARGAARL